MKPSTIHSLITLFCLALFASSFAGEKIVADMPYLVVTPQKPVAGTDSVIVQIILGTASNSCEAPTYSNLSFTIEQSPLTVYPPLFTVEVQFIQNPVPKDKVCPAIYSPVDYGPVFRLGKLRVGDYQVVPAGTDVELPARSYGGFSVYESMMPLGYALKGTVRDDPYPMDRASRPVAGAKIVLIQSAIVVNDSIRSSTLIPALPYDSAFTDENGNYSFTGVSGGSYRIVCTHADYRAFALSAWISADTVINFTLLPRLGYAFAAVTGLVTHAHPMDSHPIPLEGCTVTVGNYDPAAVVVSTVDKMMHRVITGSDGRYSAKEIPITANGQVWYIHVFRGDYSGSKRVALYNSRTDTADFFFGTPYENSASVNVDGVVFTTASDKFTYQENEPVRIRYSITYTTATTATKIFGPFAGGCEYDLIVTGATGNEIYRTSSRSSCLAVVNEIVVGPGETVVHDFPAWYLSDVKPIVSAGTIIAPRSVTLKMSARLQGAGYDNTQIGVPVTIEMEPPLKTVSTTRGNGHAGVAFNTRQEHLMLTLDKAQTVAVTIYTLGGAMIPAGSMVKQLPAGMHTLSLRSVPMSRGCYIIGVKGADFEKRFSALRAGR